MDNEKLYKEYEIKKISNIIYKPESKQEKEQEEKIDELIKSTKIKKVDVDSSNIIEEKRKRKEINYKE